ncbi:hypothetical protein M3689_05100 [Alkalihalophilus marmarensis]|uniref:Uncharacterized protein n=1 Tax=Alkalihalophilus marmarensis DSM 21297 TaxID=1188261 RepID=U6STI8_9BACI|nr:hypothetical protein [Alkalihalophilus marmarensis]ERN54697.1 hypothetical protein A33I_04950 [Alkalihalophilus marmarensis DSM 21297]MCM3488681.1 hypothetical protein [Alkalihalophilus marmarensis]
MSKEEFERLMSLLDVIQEIGSKELFSNVIDGVNRDRYNLIRTYFDGCIDNIPIKEKRE